MKKMLVSVSSKEVKIAVVNKNNLYSFNVENKNFTKINNIYLGFIINIEKSLEACFVDYGEKKLGFLPFKEIYNFNYIKKNIQYFKYNNLEIKRKKILVQVLKENKKKKGALLTNFIKLFGIYVIIFPNKPKIKAISKRINKLDYIYLNDVINKIKIPKNMGIIIRTSGSGKSIKDIQLDCNEQIKNWNKINFKKKNNVIPIKINKINNFHINILRKFLIYKLDKIIIDDFLFFNIIKKLFINFKKNNLQKKVKFFKKKTSIFNYYNIYDQIFSIFKKKIILPSGGSLVIDKTEALTVIDVNSFRSNKKLNLEETSFHTNLESIFEILKQLRLRDLRGIIIIDFINMNNIKNKKIIENIFKKNARKENSKIKVGKISLFGLLEISRQKKYFF
ncbi:MAG: ribonuclease E [Buchnera aphidicola (Periphyllus lyropictus)]|uniref:ribonuclease E/G n=1 Tax=Buchnera aphidicola TaxID=9 RepID=UPI001EB9BB77|nr:ribonuclease E/G [Buchnera aphidicola]NIH16597.1 ribonuclease E [Buchnera aphidicola (Periphyllus lyropictus)]USS94487.1 ribonuclease E/G [Buchnera aphidicola (Periphyllus lyropictus)]